VHLDQGTHQAQADAESAARALRGAVDLGEEVEDARQHVGRDADAAVAHPDHQSSALLLGGQPDLARGSGEF
jgi:hypothetical protein